MILVDTNVISEMVRPKPSAAVRAWLDNQPTTSLFVSSITIGELKFGVEVMPPGRRRNALELALQRFLAVGFDDRILGFDADAGWLYGEIRAVRRAAGQPISTEDAQIAAIARRDGMAVATRNVDDFAGIGVTVINPFDTDHPD